MAISVSPAANLINQVIHHIEKHYMDDIGIHQLATQFNITPN
jgi:YesN/AraC family two-component response regulator